LASLGGTLITAQSVYGADGNDVISLGALGITSTASSTINIPLFSLTGASGGGTANAALSVSFTASGVGNIVSGEVTLNGSAGTTYTDSTGVDVSGQAGAIVMNVSAIGVRTSEQGARTVNAAYFQANAGQDSIALGDTLTTVSATTFAGGAGNDIIGSYTNVNNQFSVSRVSGNFVATNFEGGDGNDTINLVGDAVYSAVNINANKGDDSVSLLSTVESLSNTVIGLGAGVDTFSGEFATISTATIAGGKGNDTLIISATTFDNVVIGGDRANASNTDGDGADSIYIEGGTVFTASTIFGGAGNDTVTFSAAAATASLVSLNTGKDIFSAEADGLIVDSTIAMGNQGDEFHFVDSGAILSSRINLGKGLDTTDFGGTDIGSGDFANTTLYGGAGADYLFGSATLSAGDTVAMNLEYINNSESTLSAYDTIALNTTNSGTYSFRYEPGASQASFSAAGLTGSNGVVVFSSTFATDVTARVEAIAANTTAGDAAAFLDGSSQAYLFVKGSTDNLLVQVGSATVSAVGGLGINASKNFTLDIEG
jgi:hypothetical protein